MVVDLHFRGGDHFAFCFKTLPKANLAYSILRKPAGTPDVLLFYSTMQGDVESMYKTSIFVVGNG